MNETVAQVIPIIRENRRKFREFCLSLSEDELARPVPDSTWIVKDFASHLATLDSLWDGFIASLEAGGAIDITRDAAGAAFNLDTWNDEQVTERRGWTIRQIFDEAAKNREQLIESMSRLDDDHVGRNMHFSDPKRGSGDFPLKAFLIGWAQHDPIHVADMIKALPERANDTELAAWLANPFVTGYQVSMSTAPKA